MELLDSVEETLQNYKNGEPISDGVSQSKTCSIQKSAWSITDISSLYQIHPILQDQCLVAASDNWITHLQNILLMLMFWKISFAVCIDNKLGT